MAVDVAAPVLLGVAADWLGVADPEEDAAVLGEVDGERLAAGLVDAGVDGAVVPAAGVVAGVVGLAEATGLLLSTTEVSRVNCWTGWSLSAEVM
jgi:hypothetical protein